MDLQSQFNLRERRIMEITYCPHGQASISDVIKEVKPSPSSRWTAPAGLATMISVAVALALPLGEASQAQAAANAATPSTGSGQAPNGAGTQPAGQPAAVTREQAVKAVVAELNARCPAGWDRPAIVETGQVQPFGYPKGKGWHVSTKRTGLAISDKTLDGRLDVWLMEDSFAQVGPVDLGKKQLTPLTTASECTVWPLDRAFFRGGGGSDWPSWESDIVYALGTSTPESKLRRQRVDRAEKLLAGKGLPCGLNLYNRGTGPYLEVSDPQGRWGFSVFPFPLDAAGRKIVIAHATTGPEDVLAAGRQYTLLGDAYSASTRGKEACAAIAQALDLAPVTENVIAAARAQDVKDRIDSIWLVLSRYGNDGKSETLVLSSMTYSSATKVARQQALDMIERLYEEGFFSNCYSGSYGVPAPNVPQVVINVDSRNEHSVTRCDWQSRMGWNSDTWAALKSLRGTLDGAAAARMDKFLAGFADLPAHWQKEHDAIAALPKEVRAAVDAVAQDRFPQITLYMRPPPTAQVYSGVAEEFRINPSLEQAYRQLAKGQPASLKAIGELTKAKAVWCLAGALCSEDMEVACQAAFALAELKDARPAAFVIQVARAYGAIPSERNRWSSELDNRPERMQYALATALDAMLGTSVKIKVVGEQTKWVADHEGFVKALAVWQQALDQRQQNRPASRSASSTAAALSASSGQATQPATQAAPSVTQGPAQAARLPGTTISIRDAADRASGIYVAEVLRATKGYSANPTAPTADYECFFTMRQTLRGIAYSGDCGWPVPVQAILHGEQPPEVGRQYVMFVIYDKARKLLPATPEQIDLTRRALAAPASPATQAYPKGKVLPGSRMTEEFAAGVARHCASGPIVAKAETDPQPEELGKGIYATVQHFSITNFDDIPYIDRGPDIVYSWLADRESPIAKGQTVIWFAAWDRGMKACADTPANRKLAVAAYNAAPERGLTDFKFDPRLLPNSKMTLDRAVWGSAVGIWTKQEALIAVVLDATEDNVMEMVFRAGYPIRIEKCKVVKTLFGPAIGPEVKLRYERLDPQERPMSKGERFIWIAMARLDQPGQLQGIRALVDTPANRALVVSAGKAAGIAPAPTTAPSASTSSGQATQPATDLDEAARLLADKVGGKWELRTRKLASGREVRYIDGQVVLSKPKSTWNDGRAPVDVFAFQADAQGRQTLAEFYNSMQAPFAVFGVGAGLTAVNWADPSDPAMRKVMEVLNLHPSEDSRLCLYMGAATQPASAPATQPVRQATWAAVGGESRYYQKLAGPEMEILGLVGAGGTYPAGRPEKTSWRYSVTVDHPWIAGDSRQAQEAHDVLDRLRGQREPTQFNRTPLLVKGKITPDPFAGNRPKLVVGWVRELGPDDKDWDSTCPMNLQLLPRPDDGEIALVAACQAAGPAESQLGYSGVRHARQKFKLVEVFHGDAKAGQVLDLRYSYLAPDMGFGWSGRDIRPDEKVIWVVRKVDGRLGGYGTVPDTQNNRKAALMLADRLRAAAASSATQPASARPAGTATAPATAPTTQPTAAQQAEIERLVGELGGDKFAQRLAAQEALLKIGLPALAALGTASGDANTERAERAKLLVKQIQDQAERELIDALVRAIKRDLPADWSVAHVRHGEVKPAHRPAGQGWEIRTLRSGYKPEDMKRGISVEGRLWIMDRDYVAAARPDMTPGAAQTSPARELPPWHGRGVFESGETHAAKALQETRTVDDARKQWAALIARYTSKDERYWNDSIRELDQWTDDRVIPEIVADFRNKNLDAHLRRSTLMILARMDDRKVIPIMLEAAKDSDAQVRSYAVACLGRRGGPEAFGVIEAALKDADENVRHTAMVAMGVLRDNRSLDVLLKLLEDPNDLTRRFVAEGLGELGDQHARPRLAAAMKDKSELVRRFAFLALARLGDPMVLDRLISALKTDVDGLHGWAPWALGQLGDKRAVEPLIAVMKDQDVNMRAAAVRALGKLNDRRAVEPLLAALKDADSTIRLYAAESLGELGEPRAIEALKPLLSDNNDAVRAAASNALKKLQQAAPKRPATRPAASTSSGQATQPESPLADDPELKDLGRFLSIREQAPSLAKLVAKVKPDFIFGNAGRDMMWIDRKDTGKPGFRLARAFVYQPAGQAASFVLVKPLHESGPADDPYTLVQCSGLPTEAKLHDERPMHDGGSGDYAIVKSRGPGGAGLYEIGWQTGFESRWAKERHLFVLLSGGRWQFVGEGPAEGYDKMGFGQAAAMTVDARAEWTGKADAPVRIHFVLTDTMHEWANRDTGEGDPTKAEIRDDLDKRNDWVLEGRLPGALRKVTDRPYMLARPDDTFGNVVGLLSSWVSLGSDNPSGSEANWKRELARLNPNIPAGDIPEGRRINLPTDAEMAAMPTPIKPAAQPATLPAGDPRRGAVVTVPPDKAEYFLGENVLLHWCIRNAGAQPINISIGGDGRTPGANRAIRFKVEAIDEQGKRAWDPYPNPDNFGGLGGDRTLEHGEQFHDNLQLMRYREAAGAGTYTIRVYHDLGWDRRDLPGSQAGDIPLSPHVAPVAETKVRLVMPTEAQARQVVAEMLKLPTDANRTWGKPGKPFADFELLRYPVYLPIMKELAENGDTRGLNAIGAMAFPEATAALIELAENKNLAIAGKAMELLDWRTPSPWHEDRPSRQSYLADASWNDQLRSAATASAWKLLAGTDREQIIKAARLLQSMGGRNDLPALIKVMDRVLPAFKDDPTEQAAYLRPATASGALVDAAAQIIRRGAQPPASPATPGQAVAFLVGLGVKGDFRPEGWRGRAVSLIDHQIPFIRDVALKNMPLPLDDAAIAAVARAIKDDFAPVQGAACDLAGKAKSPAFRQPLMDLLASTDNEWLVRGAFQAANECGAPMDRLLEICMARLGQNRAEISRVCHEQMINVLQYEGGYGGTVIDDWSDVAPGLKKAWTRFIAANRDAIRAGKKFPIAKDPVVPAMISPGTQFHRKGQPPWPENDPPISEAGKGDLDAILRAVIPKLPKDCQVTSAAAGRIPQGWNTTDRAGVLVEGLRGAKPFGIYFMPADWIGVRKPDKGRPNPAGWDNHGVLQGQGYKVIIRDVDVEIFAAMQKMGMLPPSLYRAYDTARRTYRRWDKKLGISARAIIEKFCKGEAERNEAVRSLLDLGVPADGLFLEYAARGAGETRGRCMDCLPFIGGPQAKRIILDSLTDPNAAYYAGYALLPVADANDGPEIAAVLDRIPHVEAATAAARALAAIDYQPAGAVILERMKHQTNKYYKVEFAQTLASLRYKPAIPFIEKMCTEKNPDANWLLSHMTLDALPEIALLRLTGDWGRKAEGGRLLLVAPEKVATDRIATLALLAEGCDLKYFEVFNFLGGYLTINGKTLPKVYDGPYDGPAGVPFGCVWCMPLWVRLDGPGPWKVQYHAADGLESNTLTLAAPAAVNAASAPAPSASSGQAARAGQTRPPEQKGRERAAADIKAGTPRILYYGKPWSLGKPLVDEASRLPVELVAGCDVMPEFVAETDAYNAAMRQWAKSRPAGAAPAAPSGASTRPGAATQTAQAAGAGTPAHGEEIVIPLDFQREAVLLPRPAALAAMHWDVAKLEDNCRAELAAQGKKGADPNRVAFGISYTNQASAVPLSGLAEVRVRPITFVAQEELKDLAARLTGKDRRAAEASLPELYRLGGRARNIVPMLLPHIKAGKSYSEVLTVVHGLGVLGPHAAEAVPALAEKFRAAEDLDKSWYALALGRVGAPAVATLERLLRQDSDEIARRAAARGLARGDPAGRRALHAALSDPSADVRAAAVAELPDDSDRETRDLVVRLLGDPSAGVRQAAAGKASLCEPALKGQAVAALLGMLSEADERSQICALYGLGALGSRPEIVVPRLKPFLQSRGEASGQTRGAALSAVARFGPAAADLAPDVIACLDGDKTQTVAALRALEAIGGKPAGAAATRVVALAASKNWGIADAATSTLFTVESDSPAHAARVVSLLSDQHVDTRQRLAGQALAAMGPAAKDALPVLASGLVSIGSIGFVPAEKVRWMAAIDAEGAVAAIENDQRAQPRRGDGFRVQDQRGGSLIILQRLKAHAAAVAEQAQDKGQRRPTREFEYLPSRDWPRVVRAGDRIERVIALLGTPDSVGGGMLTYDALPGKDPSCRPRKIVVSVEHGKATAVREEAPIAAKMVPAGEEGRPGSNARELLSGATTQPASQPASPL